MWSYDIYNRYYLQEKHAHAYTHKIYCSESNQLWKCIEKKCWYKCVPWKSKWKVKSTYKILTIYEIFLLYFLSVCLSLSFFLFKISFPWQTLLESVHFTHADISRIFPWHATQVFVSDIIQIVWFTIFYAFIVARLKITMQNCF